MEKMRIAEKELRPMNGLMMLLVLAAAEVAAVAVLVRGIAQLAAARFGAGALLLGAGIVLMIVFSLLLAGLKIVPPNEARVFTLFGRYYGTVKRAGFFYVNPLCVTFCPAYNEAKEAAAQAARERAKEGKMVSSSVSQRKTISLKMQTLENSRQKVNDVLGNPIMIGAVVIWQVVNPTDAVFQVENYQEYLSIQTDSTIRNVSRLYPYDVFTDDEGDEGAREKTLRGSALEIAATMREELQKRVQGAGLYIDEVRITHLAYAEEIAAAMLQRQQAAAIIAARQKIVDGAVGMVKMAIDKLGEDEIVVLDEERKAQMVSNLLVVLCGNRDAQPIVNSGSIY